MVKRKIEVYLWRINLQLHKFTNMLLDLAIDRNKENKSIWLLNKFIRHSMNFNNWSTSSLDKWNGRKIL